MLKEASGGKWLQRIQDNKLRLQVIFSHPKIRNSFFVIRSV